MTREEARRYMIQWQQEMKDGGFPIDSDKIQALRVAIEALSANEGLLCALAGRKCFAQGDEFAWCITCPHISEEDRQLVKHAVLFLPAEDISEDGTLKVKVEDGSKVNRVLVWGDNNFGGLYYPDDERR